jgi:hypothetical protein
MDYGSTPVYHRMRLQGEPVLFALSSALADQNAGFLLLAEGLNGCFSPDVKL